MTLLSLAKRYAVRTPQSLGCLLAHVPYRIRPGFGAAYRRALRDMDWFQNIATAQEQRQFIFQHVRAIVVHAVEHTRFYRDYYAENGFSLDDLKSFDDIKKIPMTSKALLRDVPLNDRSAPWHGRTLTYTGGSTGEPFKFYSAPEQVGNEWAHMHMIWGRLGYRQRDLLLNIALEPTASPVYYDALRHALVLNIHHPRTEIARSFLQLAPWRRNVRFYRGYPSSFAEWLDSTDASVQQMNAVLRSTLRGSFLASEFPLPSMRRIIEDVTGRPTTSWYGHAERAILAPEKTERDGYKPLQSYGFCETSIDDGLCSLVGTCYWNYASPLIRYRVDDDVTPQETRDGILRAFCIDRGRFGDYIVDKGGEKFSITHLNLSCRENTWALARTIQVEQSQPGKIIIWTTLRRPCSVEELTRAFDFEYLNMDCEFRIISEPFRTPAGKVLLKVTSEQTRGADWER
ncbi:MAG: hypothetical protein Q4G03_07520 [Planctomycetia bacterium]|nr:hypothetical protein [Planctomycetia bacterium]